MFRSVLLFVAAAVAVADKPTVVQTNSGPVRGVLEDRARVFRGIPYAADAKTRRWQNPVPPKPWTATRDAFEDGPGCPQVCVLPSIACPPVQSEDCLYLNVFTPLLTSEALTPVMVFIHGGDYVQGYGGGPLYDGTPMANSSGLILVALNYRLGALGFAYAGDLAGGQLAGNYGFLDQRLALKWVQDNIKNFGGDPGRVTIFGQSAGAMSVALHLVSSGSRGLFSAAIIESEPLGLPLRSKVH